MSRVRTPPIVVDSGGLVQPFFSTGRLPCSISTRHLEYLFRGLSELSQLVHYVAVNSPASGCRVNHLLRDYLIFHLNRFFDVTLRVPLFWSRMKPKDERDREAVELLRNLINESEEFLNLWDDRFKCGHSQEPWVETVEMWKRVQRKADRISGSVVAVGRCHERFIIQLSWLQEVDLILSQQPLSVTFICSALASAALLFIFVSVFSLLLWKHHSFGYSVVINCLAAVLYLAVGLSIYALSRRGALAELYADELTFNISQVFFARETQAMFEEKPLELEFCTSMRGGMPQTLAVLEREVSSLLVMIGFDEDLTILTWNAAAESCTRFKKSEAVGRSLELIASARSCESLRDFADHASTNPLTSLSIHLNTLNSEPIKINAQLSCAFLNAERMFLLLGTVIPGNESLMRYLFNLSTAYLTQQLTTIGLSSKCAVFDIISSSSWEAIAEKAARPWSTVDITHFIQVLQAMEKQTFHFSHLDSGLFHCDIKSVDDCLLVMAGMSIDEVTHVHFTVVSVKQELSMLKVYMKSSGFDRSSAAREKLCEAGFVLTWEESALEVLFPVAVRGALRDDFELPSTFEPERHQHKIALYTGFVLCFLVMSDCHFSYLIRNYSSDHHHFIRVAGLKELRVELNRNDHVICGVLIDEHDDDCLHAVEEVKQRPPSILAVLISAKMNEDFAPHPHNYPEHVDYLLSSLSNTAWSQFLQHVSLHLQEQRLHRNLSSYSTTTGSLKTVSCISYGAHSRVNLVEDTLTGGRMAMKSIVTSEEEGMEKASNEIKFIEGVGEHRGLLQCLGVHRTASEVSILYPFCANGTLREYVEHNAPLSLSKLVVYARQVIEAVAYIHSKGFSHCDIKPENIFIDYQGNLRLGDFGSCTSSPQQVALQGRTLTYIPPEQVMNMPETLPFMNQHYAADMWSVGLTLLEIIGCYPAVLKGKSMAELLEVYSRHYNEGREIEFTIHVLDDNRQGSKEAFLFFEDILRMRPGRRLQAAEALHHNFLTSM